MKQLTISETKVSKNQPGFMIAELLTSYLQKFELVVDMIKEAKIARNNARNSNNRL